MKHNDKRNGIWIPKELMADKNLDWTNKALLAEIMNLSELEKGCYASNEHFAQLLGIGKSSVSKRITQLQKMGYIITNNIFDKNRCIGRVIQPTYRNSVASKDGIESIPESSSQKNHPDPIESPESSSLKNQGMVPGPVEDSSNEDKVVVPERPGGSSQKNTNNTSINTDIKNNINIPVLEPDTGASNTGEFILEDYLTRNSYTIEPDAPYGMCRKEHSSIISSILDNPPNWEQELITSSDVNSFLNKYKNQLQKSAKRWVEDREPDGDIFTEDEWFDWYIEFITAFYYR